MLTRNLMLKLANSHIILRKSKGSVTLIPIRSMMKTFKVLLVLFKKKDLTRKGVKLVEQRVILKKVHVINWSNNL